MDNLRAAIADKILDLSTLGGDNIKSKLENINRFRDFADACKSLIEKYPAIGVELLRMVENNDFDTKVASSRVDTIIRLSETNTPNRQIQPNTIEQDITELEKIEEHLPSNLDTDIVAQKDEPQQYLPEEVDYEEVASTSDTEKGYADFEEVRSLNVTSQNDENLVKEVDESDSKKETIKKVLLVAGVIAVAVALVFIVLFVINNWEMILWVLGIALILGIVGFVIKRNLKK